MEGPHSGADRAHGQRLGAGHVVVLLQAPVEVAACVLHSPDRLALLVVHLAKQLAACRSRASAVAMAGMEQRGALQPLQTF